MKSSTESEKRKSRRRPILSTFSFSLVIPKKGPLRLEVLDVSEDGIGFLLDVEGEPTAPFPANLGDQLDVHFYLNSSLYIPLKIQIARIENLPAGRRAGAVFEDKTAPAYKAFSPFLSFLDGLVTVSKVDA